MMDSLLKVRFIIVAALLFFIAPNANADLGKGQKLYPKGSPVRAIQNLDKMLGTFKTGKGLSKSDIAYNQKLKSEIIHGTFDIGELSALALNVHWKSLSEQQKNEFETLLINLLEEKALFSKEQSAAKSKKGGKYYVVYGGARYADKDKKRAYVKTKVIVPSENVDVNLNYKLVKLGNEWKVYDIIVDEASLLLNYRYQFDQIIKKHGYGELVSRMQRKLTEIQQRRKNDS